TFLGISENEIYLGFVPSHAHFASIFFVSSTFLRPFTRVTTSQIFVATNLWLYPAMCPYLDPVRNLPVTVRFMIPSSGAARRAARESSSMSFGISSQTLPLSLHPKQ